MIPNLVNILIFKYLCFLKFKFLITTTIIIIILFKFNKIDIEDVNKALIGIHKELDVKSNQAELNNIVSDQAIINESLCTENIVGRWTWKSGFF